MNAPPGVKHTISIPADATCGQVVDFLIERALTVFESPTKAARHLGIGRATIYRWIQKHPPCDHCKRHTAKTCNGCDSPLCDACHREGHECQ